jgi:hypothetical protein
MRIKEVYSATQPEYGEAPIMNHDLMNTNVTSDLITGPPRWRQLDWKLIKKCIPCQDVVASLNDLMFIVSHIKFFDKVTKPCKIPGMNTQFYRIPVKQKLKRR